MVNKYRHRGRLKTLTSLLERLNFLLGGCKTGLEELSSRRIVSLAIAFNARLLNVEGSRRQVHLIWIAFTVEQVSK